MLAVRSGSNHSHGYMKLRTGNGVFRMWRLWPRMVRMRERRQH